MHFVRPAAVGAAAIGIAAAAALATAVVAAVDDLPAKQLFSEVTVPSPGAPKSIGSYAEGCLAGAVPLPVTGPRWQVTRLSRNRNWGTPELVTYIEKLATDAAKDGWSGLLVGDMSQPRGGPMITGHTSHQIGLDVDIWYLAMPDHVLSADERETIGAPSMLIDGKLAVDPAMWTPERAALLKRAASFPEVARIFVSAGIKKSLCETATGDRSWLAKIRPWYAHEDHFHVRLTCPTGMATCINQPPVDADDGCGADLAWWLRPQPPEPPPKPPFTLPKETTLSDLPSACTGVVTATPGGLAPAALKIPTPLPRPRPGD
jgi:penicillin-insensitive murein endopeptidase